MSELSKQALKVENTQSFPNNNAGLITPTNLRTFNEDMIDSTVNQATYTTDSASFDSRINAITGSGGSANTGSLLTTASFDNNTRNLTFTKGDSSQFNVNIPDVSGSILPAGVVSGSSQINYPQISNIPSGIVSGSSQLTASYDLRYQLSGSAVSINTGSLVTTSSFNAYTQSVDTSISALNTFSSSQLGKDSTLGLYTQSNDTKWSNLGSQSGSFVTESETGSFARVNVSNTFTATQQFGDVNVTGTANIRILNVTYESSSVIYSSGSNQFGDELTDNQILSGSVKVVGSLTVNGVNVITSSTDISALNSFTASQETKNATLAIYTASVDSSISQLNSFTSSQLVVNSNLNASSASQQISINNLNSFTASYVPTNLGPLNAFTQSQEVLNAKFATTGSNTFNGVQTIRAITGTPLIVDHSDASPTQNTFIGIQSSGSAAWLFGNNGTTEEFILYNPNTFQSPLAIRQDDSVQLLGNLTASLQQGYVWAGGVGNVSKLVATSSFVSAPINTGSFATTGSNTFVGTQTITGDGINIYNQNAAINLSANSKGSGSQYPGVNMIVAPNVYPTDIYGGYIIQTELGAQNGLTFLGMAANSYTPQYGGTTVPTIVANGFNPDGNDTAIIWKNDGTAEHWKKSDFKYGVNITGSLNIQSTLSASLQQGYAWVGGVGNRTIAVPTSSFSGGGGGASFPYTGSAVITGSLAVTGSMSGYVNALTITSQTASLNFNDGNFFTLQLVSGSITHLTATNIKPGQAINLLVKMDAVAGVTSSSGSLTFSPTFKFAGGIDYTPTRITGSQDLVSFVTFDTTQVLAAQVKNLS